jgi:hypothetical protein
MSTDAEKTSWRWQLEQLQQQVREWIEVKFQSNDRDLQLDIFPSWLGSFLIRLAWLLLAGILIWIGYRFIYPAWQRWRRDRQDRNIPLDSSQIATYTVAELLAKSQQFYSDGDYTQASRWLYFAMLQRLNDANIIPDRVSLTDREYLQLLKTVLIVDVGETLVSIHERLHFGNEQIAIEDFNRCQQAYRQMEEELRIEN